MKNIISDEILLIIVETMLEKLKEAVIKDPKSIGLCVLYYSTLDSLFLRKNAPYRYKMLEDNKFAHDLVQLKFYNLDKVLSLDYAVKYFGARRGQCYWWDYLNGDIRQEFLRNAVKVIQRRMKNETRINNLLSWLKNFLLKLK